MGTETAELRKMLPVMTMKRQLMRLRENLVWRLRWLYTGVFTGWIYKKNVYSHRTAIARFFLRPGMSGIEIGGGNNPLKLPGSINVKYVDKHPVEKLLKLMKDNNYFTRRDLAKVDIVDEAETLSSIAPGSQDFVIANHVLEHCRDPLLAVANMLRVLRDAGILFISVPDKRYTFDAPRPITTLEHLKADRAGGAGVSSKKHFEEWAELVESVSGKENIEKRATSLIDQDFSIHYHVWTSWEMMELFSHVHETSGYSFDIEHLSFNHIEVLFVFRKRLEDK